MAKGGTVKAEAAKLQDAGLSPKSARENEWQKKSGLTGLSKSRHVERTHASKHSGTRLEDQ